MRIREALSNDDLDEIARIQREVWRIDDLEIVGRFQMRAALHAGGSILVAEADDGAFAGFAYALAGLKHGEFFWHSDMLAVRKPFRGQGIGQDLKWAQRGKALEAGIKKITWTFDPMQSGNANLNLTLLGATAREYLENFYGVTTSSLHHGLPTDRLMASWDLESPRVTALAAHKAEAGATATLMVSIPASWNDLVQVDPQVARSEQGRVRDTLKKAFQKGLVAAGFDKPTSSYLLSPADRL